MIELPVLDSSVKGERSARNRFWRSISHLRNDPEFARIASEEFLPAASDGPGGASRRQFLQIMGASMALAGLSACRRPVKTIMPFSHKPEQLIPGIPLDYATAMPFRGHLRSLLVENTDGRPTKIEGNPDHPDAQGATGVFEQASLLSLYDPDRSRNVRRDGLTSSWSDLRAYLRNIAAGSQIAVLAAPDSSPTRASLRSSLESTYRVKWVEYDATGDNAFTAASLRLYGRPLRPRYRFDQASVIVSLDADFLGPTVTDFVANTRGFAESRDADKKSEISRLYAVESQYSITGGMADHRLRVRSSDIAAFTAALASALGISVSGGEAFAAHPYITEIAADLLKAGSTGVVLAGETQDATVHALCLAINDFLGAPGHSVTYYDADPAGASRLRDLADLVEDMKQGSVDLLLMLGVNPVYDAPTDLDFAGALSGLEESVHLGLHVNETAAASRWHVPEAHFLESWGDGRSIDGTLSVIQPLIAPLYEDAHTASELLAVLTGASGKTGYDLVRERWGSFIPGDFERGWKKVLHDGFVVGGVPKPVSPSLKTTAVPGSVSGPIDGLEVVVRLDPKLLDGSFANNAWMQELPDPTTKIVWDNVAMMSPATAEELGVGMDLRNGRYFVDRVTLTADGRSVDLPVWIQPGMADQSIAVSLGYGGSILSERAERSSSLFDLDDYTDVYGHGAISNGVGANVSLLRTVGAMSIITGVSVTVSGSNYLVASTQDHGALEEEGEEVKKRGIFRMATVDEYRTDPEFVHEEEPELIREDWESYPALWEDNHPTRSDEVRDNDFFQYQWGMVIDLNTCTGCNACVVACQSENNIQVVGKEEVSRGREMHWIRLDRYFVSGDGGSWENPDLVIQPIPCMHCENAPCEEVCPVAATVHSADGTNQMIYNRCIGTRYCANNCPYKVRRFNFYNWTKTLPLSLHMAQNPNVTVRSRGVMEKCSYCIQRVREANKRVNLEKRTIREGEIQTACQQVCPARAITFGDLKKPESQVSLLKKNPREYGLLAELGVKPRTSFLGRIRNPNPNLVQEA